MTYVWPYIFARFISGNFHADAKRKPMYGHTYIARLFRFYILILCSLFAATVSAQVKDEASALDHFNRASKEYIKKDKLSALRILDEGLRNYPGDPRMLKLAEELLKESQQQQQEQQKKEEQKEQEKKEQEQKDKQGEEKEQDDGEKGPEQKPQERDQPKPAEQAQRKPGTIAPEDARRMLDALDRQERKVQDKVRENQRPVSRLPIEKDW